MLVNEIHPEDIKAAIKKRYRTLVAFEAAEKLAKNAMGDFLRGKKSARTERAVRRVLAEDGKWQFIGSMNQGSSKRGAEAHRLNDVAA